MTNSENVAVSTETQPESSHTPGPWVSFYKHKYDEWHVGVPVSSGSMKLALFPDGCPTENPEADCRLIAAAPELLFALKAMVGWQAEVKHAIPLSYLDGAKAAIAKAEGRS